MTRRGLIGVLFEAAYIEELSEDEQPPSYDAYQIARGLLDRACMQYPLNFPVPNIYADGFGGIRAEWSNQNRELILVVRKGATDKHYIYHREGCTSATDYNVDASGLQQWITWLVTGDYQKLGN